MSTLVKNILFPPATVNVVFVLSIGTFPHSQYCKIALKRFYFHSYTYKARIQKGTYKGYRYSKIFQRRSSAACVDGQLNKMKLKEIYCCTEFARSRFKLKLLARVPPS